MDSLKLNDDLLRKVFVSLGPRDRVAVMATSKRLRTLALDHKLWENMFDETSATSDDLDAGTVVRCIKMANGHTTSLGFPRSPIAVQQANTKRFSKGLRYNQMLPFTKGLRAFSLAALLPNLQALSLDERTSCLGGMTNDLARAVSLHCRQLRRFAVYFSPCSLPSELFTDQGLIELSEGCRELQELRLINCCIGDRSLYALAANCKDLAELRVGGYSERVTDSGVQVITAACKQLRSLHLSSKLYKVTDSATGAIATYCTALRQLKLSRAVTDSSLEALAEGPAATALQQLNVRKSSGVTLGALDVLLRVGVGRGQLQRLLLPPQLKLPAALAGMPVLGACSSSQGMQHPGLVQQQRLAVAAEGAEGQAAEGLPRLLARRSAKCLELQVQR